MKGITRIVGVTWAASLVAAGAWAAVRQTPLSNTLGPRETRGGAVGFAVQGAAEGRTLGPGIALYDNTAGPSVGYFDWGTPFAQWADDLHSLATAPATVNTIAYNYFNTGGFGPTVSHTIRLYDMLPPSGTHGNSSAGGPHPVPDKGPLLTSIFVPGLVGTGSFAITVTGLSIPVPGSAVWIAFNEANSNPTFAGPTFWLSGGLPVTGSSHDTLGSFVAGGGPYDHYPHAIAPYSNIMVALLGMATPVPGLTGWGVTLLAALMLLAGTILIVRQIARRGAAPA